MVIFVFLNQATFIKLDLRLIQNTLHIAPQETKIKFTQQVLEQTHPPPLPQAPNLIEILSAVTEMKHVEWHTTFALFFHFIQITHENCFFSASEIRILYANQPYTCTLYETEISIQFGGKYHADNVPFCLYEWSLILPLCYSTPVLIFKFSHASSPTKIAFMFQWLQQKIGNFFTHSFEQALCPITDSNIFCLDSDPQLIPMGAGVAQWYSAGLRAG
jgi:hypothetical protein